jgi:hypothetical protein
VSDGRLTYEQAAAGFGEWVAELMDTDEGSARSLLGLSSRAPLVLSEALQKRGAFTWQLAAAVAGCEHDCGHDERDRYAHLRFSLVSCRECMEGFHLRPRENDGLDCDICGRGLDPLATFAAIEHYYAGPPKLFVLARGCVPCGEVKGALMLPPVPLSQN